MMVLANYMGGVMIIPDWLKHAADIGLTVTDLIAPMFIFAIGLTFSLSFRRRAERDGLKRTYNHFFTRFLAILGMGAAISAGETAFGENLSGVDWGALQSIGIAGLVALAVIRLPSFYRWLTGLALLALYQFLLDCFLLPIVMRSPHGGLVGSFSWAAMLILATALADLFHDTRRGYKWYLWVTVFILAAGIALAFVSPVSKLRVSAAYVWVSLGASSLIFATFHWLSERFQLKSRLFVVWGKNPLVLYFLHFVLIGIVFLPGIPVLYTEAPLWLVLLEIAGLLGALTAIAFWMERRNLIFSL